MADFSAPATKGDLAELQKATKADLGAAQKATSADLAALRQATAADIKRLGEDIRSEMATKAELKEVQRSLTLELLKRDDRIDRLEEKLDRRLTEESSRILKAVGNFAVQCQKVDRDQIITHYRIDELEKRVSALES